jgi:hypothetical protein
VDPDFIYIYIYIYILEDRLLVEYGAVDGMRICKRITIHGNSLPLAAP